LKIEKPITTSPHYFTTTGAIIHTSAVTRQKRYFWLRRGRLLCWERKWGTAHFEHTVGGPISPRANIVLYTYIYDDPRNAPAIMAGLGMLIPASP